MKIAICSDVHLEFGPLTLENPGDVEVLILSGDICVAADLRVPDPYQIVSTRHMDHFNELMDSCSKNFPHTIMVMGNHEHYHGDFAKTAETIRNHLKPYQNIHFLDKETFDLGDVRFIGGTLWTDMNKENPVTLMNIKGMMNDYKGVINSNREVSYKVFESDDDKPTFKTRPATFSPEDSVEDHKKMLDVINKTLAETPPWVSVVVVGHHAPSTASTHPRYKNQVIMNGAYSSDLSELILNNPQIKLWTHGHTHEDFDYMIGSTRIVCNPRGYDGYEVRASRFELKVVEL